jgi:ferritin-like metal-binding protein YciE
MADISSPRELFAHKLGTTLTMEKELVETLNQLAQKANKPELKQQLLHHRQETQQQVRNIERAFDALGEEPEEQPSPAIEGITKEGKQNIRQADDSLVDAVILSGAVATEAHEIAVYDGLITQAEAMGEEDIVALLQENLEQEQHTLQEARKAAKHLAQRVAQTA